MIWKSAANRRNIFCFHFKNEMKNCTGVFPYDVTFLRRVTAWTELVVDWWKFSMAEFTLNAEGQGGITWHNSRWCLLLSKQVCSLSLQFMAGNCLRSNSEKSCGFISWRGRRTWAVQHQAVPCSSEECTSWSVGARPCLPPGWIQLQIWGTGFRDFLSEDARLVLGDLLWFQGDTLAAVQRR